MKKLIHKKDSFFIAGHNGMVGSAIVRCLLKNGYCEPDNGGKLFHPSKNELDLVLAKSQLLLVGKDIDLTDQAIKELNKILPKISKN